MPKFLLHTCCAPCSIAIIEELKDEFALTVLFYNPNIQPEEEYLKRKAEVVKVCSEWDVPIVDMDYETERWREVVRGLENEPEGGARCSQCFNLRLDQTANYAAKHGFDFFGTSLTSGRNKKAAVIHPIATALGSRYGVEFFAVDWKKGGRQERANKLVAERKIYRQIYCGCVYSK
ncbi:MAG TPA: epoxyqueuosine reductase QueH [Patescibacteria group bacterium]|nr:epoxyqueuosine reductase QueH [Patescibacteria group bacterium]